MDREGLSTLQRTSTPSTSDDAVVIVQQPGEMEMIGVSSRTLEMWREARCADAECPRARGEAPGGAPPRGGPRGAPGRDPGRDPRDAPDRDPRGYTHDDEFYGIDPYMQIGICVIAMIGVVFLIMSTSMISSREASP